MARLELLDTSFSHSLLLMQMGLDPMLTPEAVHGAPRNTQFGGHFSAGVQRMICLRGGEDFRLDLRRDSFRATRTLGVFQSFNSLL